MKSLKLPFVLLLSGTLTACASDGEQPKLDYQTNNQRVVSLDVPPDLTNPNQGDRYALPAGSGAVRASDLARARQASAANADSPVLAEVRNIRIQREGGERWLNVGNKTPAQIWPLLHAFWQEQGFVIAREEPGIGLMETDWAENRAKLPQDGLRRLFDRIGLGSVYSTGERDKFTIRLERNSKGGTDIFFSHRGMKETYADRNKDTTMWQPAPRDADLEAAFLGRFMQYLGADEQQIERELSRRSAAQAGELATLQGNQVLVRGEQSRNWRRVSLALDRIGLNITGENPQRHAYLVQVAPAEGEAVRNEQPGFFARLFGSRRPAEPEKLPEFVVVVEPQANNTSRIFLSNKDGSAYQGNDAQTWLRRLYQELR
ncbi:MAG: outer membrane protein assembly factor BamC [Eikenella sp.]|nr:outer membrane protein assembly factor BamC [Eikenella sp.]